MPTVPKRIGLGVSTEALPRSITIFTGALVAADHNTPVVDAQQSGCDDLIVVIDFHKVGSAPSIVFTIQGVCFPNGPDGAAVVWPILASAAVTATGVVVLRVSDSMEAVANLTAQDIVPDYFQVVCDHSNTDTATYSITAVLAP